MELDPLLTVFDKVVVNLEKLERVWERASPHLPSGPAFGSSAEYQNLMRTWRDLLPGLPPIDGWTITDELPDADDLGRMFLDYGEIGELPTGAWAMAEQPGEDLANYRYRLDRARRRAIASRLTVLTGQVTDLVRQIAADLPTREAWIADKTIPPREAIRTPAVIDVETAIAEIERLLGDTVVRKGRWGDLHRHLRFSEVHDWLDISELDWPSVRTDIEAAQGGDSDPIPVPDMDLGIAGAASPTGAATTALQWSALGADQFERLLYDILRSLDGYQNVEWLMKTNAPDRGRDISLQRVINDSAGSTRYERVFVQAKHYTSKSVGPADVRDSLSRLPLWEPPVIRSLIIATSGRFSSDAVGVVDKHNDLGTRPHIELWPDSRLETLLAQRPGLAITYGLRS
jgi:hypothetical protein